jgi:hypothetical protein
LYECLTGRVPFEGDSDASTALARLQHAAKPVRALRPGVPRPLDELISACLTRSPDGRPASGADVRDSLTRLDGAAADDGHLVIERDPTPSGNAPLLALTPTLADAGLSRRAKRRIRPGRWTVAFGVVLLIGLGAGTAGALVRGSRNLAIGRSPRATDDSLPVVTSAAPPSVASTEAPPTSIEPIRGRGIAGTGEFDPPPGDGTENAALLPLLTDNDASTEWRTLCYEDNHLAPKNGVGIVIRLTAAAKGKALSVQSPTAGWSASVYVGSSWHKTLKTWGSPVATGANMPAGQVLFPLSGEGSFALLWITQLGPSTNCRLPNEVRIGDVRVVDQPGK